MVGALVDRALVAAISSARSSPPSTGPFAGASPRRADRASEPGPGLRDWIAQALRRPQRLPRAVHADDHRRPRRLQGSGTTSRGHGAGDAGAPVCSPGASRRSCGRATRSRASAATSSSSSRSDATTTTRLLRSSDGSGTRFAGRSASRARAWRSTAASAGRSSPRTERRRTSSWRALTGRCTRRSATARTTPCSSAVASTPASSATSSRRSSTTSSSSSTSRSSTSRPASRTPPRRWCAGVLPDEALLPPAEFVPHVERTPLVRELTFIVDRRRASGHADLVRRGHDLGVSVNVPYRLLDDPLFVEGLARPASDSDVQSRGDAHTRGRPGRPRRRVRARRGGARRGSRHSASASRSTTAAALHRSRRSASSRSTSSRSTPASYTALGRSETDAALVRGLIEIGHTLGLSVVAEGVETREAWNVLASWGCDYAQGFYVASPRPADDLVDWLARRWPAVA